MWPCSSVYHRWLAPDLAQDPAQHEKDSFCTARSQAQPCVLVKAFTLVLLSQSLRSGNSDLHYGPVERWGSLGTAVLQRWQAHTVYKSTSLSIHSPDLFSSDDYAKTRISGAMSTYVLRPRVAQVVMRDLLFED